LASYLTRLERGLFSLNIFYFHAAYRGSTVGCFLPCEARDCPGASEVHLLPRSHPPRCWGCFGVLLGAPCFFSLRSRPAHGKHCIGCFPSGPYGPARPSPHPPPGMLANCPDAAGAVWLVPNEPVIGTLGYFSYWLASPTGSIGAPQPASSVALLPRRVRSKAPTPRRCRGVLARSSAVC
jgi:hypothetical protein